MQEDSTYEFKARANERDECVRSRRVAGQREEQTSSIGYAGIWEGIKRRMGDTDNEVSDQEKATEEGVFTC